MFGKMVSTFMVVVLLLILLSLSHSSHVDSSHISRKLQDVLTDTSARAAMNSSSSRGASIGNRTMGARAAMNSSSSRGASIGNQTMGASSSKMSEYISTYPTEWRVPIKICTVADESYISSIDIFVRTLLTFGFNSSDISIFCITTECTLMLKQINIEGKFIQVDECATAPMTRMKCLISLGKARAIHTTLSLGLSVLFFDLDVYFKSSPLDNFRPEPHIQIYAQEDDVRKTANYGCILIRPTNETVSAFTELETEALSGVWDQRLVNNQIKNRHIPFSFLDGSQYSVFLHKAESFPTNMTLLHMICVEGPLNKRLVGSQRAGPFETPFLYTHNRSIAIHVDYESPERRASYTRHQLVAMVQRLIEISATIGCKVIRLAGWKYFKPVKSLFDADLLSSQYNITLVEERYWEYFKKFNSGFNLTSFNYSVSNQQDYDRLLKSYSDNNFDMANDIFFSFNSTFLDGSSYDSKYEQLLCSSFDASSVKCTRTCSGKHFRLRN